MSATPPAAKRARSGAGGSDQAPTPAECDKLVKHLSKKSAHALLAKFAASSPEVHAAVEAEANRRGPKPVNLATISDETVRIVCRTALDKLDDLVGECKETLSKTDAFVALVTIIEVAYAEAPDRVWSEQFSGNFESQIAEDLTNLHEGMSSEEKASIGDTAEQLDGVVEAMKMNGQGGDLMEVAIRLRGPWDPGEENLQVLRDLGY